MNRVFAVGVRYSLGSYRQVYQVVASTASRATRMALARAKADGLSKPHAIADLKDHGLAVEPPKPIQLIGRRTRARR